MADKYQKALVYIERFWRKNSVSLKKDLGMHIALPHPFVEPSLSRFKFDQYYWDTYFIILGLIEMGKVGLAKGMVENLIWLYRRFGLISAANRYYKLTMSQPPFLTSMILEVYGRTRDKHWLARTAAVAEEEYKNYWLDPRHLVFKGLSRYCDYYVTHKVAEYESGWDMTSRFSDRALDFLPVDLNSLLFKYECDLAEISRLLKNASKYAYYQRRAQARQRAVQRLMWNESKGFFFDYDYKLKKQSSFFSLAGFYPLWAGLATHRQAQKVRDNLKRFEGKGGLANTQKGGLLKPFRQWDYPNGWPNQQYIAIGGLLNYGYTREAKKLAEKWLELNWKTFQKTGTFWEKYDVVKCTYGKEDRYPNQTGFGWTVAVFVKLTSLLNKI